jgi:hypothetical protein
MPIIEGNTVRLTGLDILSLKTAAIVCERLSTALRETADNARVEPLGEELWALAEHWAVPRRRAVDGPGE